MAKQLKFPQLEEPPVQYYLAYLTRKVFDPEDWRQGRKARKARKSATEKKRKG
jgi:hypothetical protein